MPVAFNPKELVKKPELQTPLEVSIWATHVSVELKDCFQAAKRWEAGLRIVQTRWSGMGLVSEHPCNELVATREGEGFLQDSV